jgi:hypothetical protein
MRYQLMTVGDDPNFYDPFSWDPPDKKVLSSVTFQPKLGDVFRPDIFLARYYGNYSVADLIYWFNGFPSFPDLFTYSDIVNYDLDRVGQLPAGETAPTTDQLVTYLQSQLFLLPDPQELQAYVQANQV